MSVTLQGLEACKKKLLITLRKKFALIGISQYSISACKCSRAEVLNLFRLVYPFPNKKSIIYPPLLGGPCEEK